MFELVNSNETRAMPIILRFIPKINGTLTQVPNGIRPLSALRLRCGVILMLLQLHRNSHLVHADKKLGVHRSNNTEIARYL